MPARQYCWNVQPCWKGRVGAVLGALNPTSPASNNNSSSNSSSRSSSSAEDCSFESRADGSVQRYVAIWPKGFPGARPSYDVLIALHGHGSDRWQFAVDERGECAGARDVAQRHNMIYITPDYRAPTSWMGPEAEADMVQLIGLLRQRYPLDHVVLTGGSMGGTGALTFTALHPDLVDGVCSLNGTADLVNYHNFDGAIDPSFSQGSGDVATIARERACRSAGLHPASFTMPFSATTGGLDESVPPDSVLKLVRDIQEARSYVGTPVNKHVLSIHRPDVGHETNYEDTVAALEFVMSALARPTCS